ncbi:MAG: hypothetical protein ACTMK5_05315, partial [Pseudomonas helleri]
ASDIRFRLGMWASWSAYNLSAVVNGITPCVKTSGRAGVAVKIELNHKVYAPKGGAFYDVNNIAVVAPRLHK